MDEDKWARLHNVSPEDMDEVEKSDFLRDLCSEYRKNSE